MSKSGSMNRRYPPEDDGGSTPTAPEPRVQTFDPSVEDVTPAPVEALDRSSEASWDTRYWRVLAIAFGALVLAGSAALAIETGKVAPLFMAALAAVVGVSVKTCITTANPMTRHILNCLIDIILLHDQFAVHHIHSARKANFA